MRPSHQAALPLPIPHGGYRCGNQAMIGGGWIRMPSATSSIRLPRGSRNARYVTTQSFTHTPRWMPNGMTNRTPAGERRPTIRARLTKRPCLLYTSDAADEEDSVDL